MWRSKAAHTVQEDDNSSVVDRLDRLGYLNCTRLHDNTHARCRHKSAQFSWLNYVWEGRPQRTASAAARTVSWWLGEGDAAIDPFDAETFLELLSRLPLDPGELPAHRRPATVFFVGDSTARQQAVSLCCLLRAGFAAAGSTHSVDVTVSIPFLTFACKVVGRDPATGARTNLAGIRYVRCNRGDSLPPWRPLEQTPSLDYELARTIAKAPDVLIINLGAWNFEDGCRDMHSLHDGLCNGTRPWILHEYAQQWTLLAGALNEAYSPSKRPRSLVLLRTASPRDFEGGKHPVGRCRRTSPMGEAELIEQEERVDLGGMRVAVLTKNLILDAVATQRMPWVRVLDAYEISRARVDAHPSRCAHLPRAFRGLLLAPLRAPRRSPSIPNPLAVVAPRGTASATPCHIFTPCPPPNKRSSGKRTEDCVHYCLPGVPDVYNGRFLSILDEVVRGTGGRMGTAADGAAGARHKNSIGAPGTVLHRFNFRYGDLPFVDVVKLSGTNGMRATEGRAVRAQTYTSLSLRLDPSSSAAMLIECPWIGTPQNMEHGWSNGSLGLGVCSDIKDSRASWARSRRRGQGGLDRQ